MHPKRRWLPRWQRVELVEKCLVEGMSRREAAQWRRVSVSTVQYWVDRYRAASEQDRVSLAWADDRPCTPHRQPARCSERVHDRVCRARKRTGWGPRLIASELGMSHATVWRCLRRRGVSRAPSSPREQVRRFEWPCPGDLCRWTSSASSGSPGPGTVSPVIATGPRKRSATVRASSSATRSSTTTVAWPTASCTAMSRRRPSQRSLRGHSSSSPATASPPGGCRPTDESQVPLVGGGLLWLSLCGCG